MVERGRAVSAVELMDAVDELARWSRYIRRAYADFDILLTPTLPAPPPTLGTIDPLQPIEKLQREGGALAAFVLPFDVTGQPAISLPTHWSRSGLPVGVQLVAAYGREDRLFQLARLVEQAMPWHDRTPVGAE